MSLIRNEPTPHLSEQISNAAVVQHRACSVSGQAVAAGCPGTLIKPVSKEKPENQNRFIIHGTVCSWKHHHASSDFRWIR